MDSRVSPESGGLIGGVLALCANKWLLTTVNPHVISEAAQSIDCEVAWIATVGLLFIIQRLLGAEFSKLKKMEIWSDVTIAGRTDNEQKGKIELLSQWTMDG